MVTNVMNTDGLISMADSSLCARILAAVASDTDDTLIEVAI